MIPLSEPDTQSPISDSDLFDLLAVAMDSRPAAADKTLVQTFVPVGTTGSVGATAAPIAGDAVTAETILPQRYGRYEVVRKLGEGGMGAVYLSHDTVTGQYVALKVLSDWCLKDADAFQRFEKEARLLEEAHSPFIANMLDLGREGRTRFLVMEYVEGTDLRRWMASREPVDETTALDIACDLCRAVATLHARGMVHRDIKPENVLLSELEGTDRPNIKLTDFGLARHIDQSESLKLTQTGVLLGTPYYMAPEQFRGNVEVSTATDVYALGITLFELLAGRRPFQANDPIKLAAAHCFEAPPDLRKIVSRVTDGAAELVLRTMAKDPANRPADAAVLLEEILRLRSGSAALLALHPTLPVHDPKKVLIANFEWDLKSSPESLWRYVSDTDRFNQAAGIPPVTYDMVRDEAGRTRKFGQFRMAGMAIRWEEHPFEWIEGRRFSVLREFAAGPFVWFLSTVELTTLPEGGTRLVHHVKILPRGIAGRLLATLEVGVKGRRNLDRIYRRIDARIDTDAERVDHFRSAPSPSLIQRTRLSRQLDQLRSEGVGPQITTVLHDLMTCFAPQDLARIQPYAIARRYGLPERDMVDACLRAVRSGLFTMYWDVICPGCRLSAGGRQTLREIERHSSCPACQLDFKLEFGSLIELVFRAHPEIRASDGRLYCNGGPGNFPHVVAQVNLEPGERFLMTLSLEPGSYILRGPRLPYTVPVEVDSARGVRHGRIDCAPGRDRQAIPTFLAGNQQITIENFFRDRQLVRLERNVRRADALTAAQATALPLFRELFPQEILAPGQLVELATTNFLAIQWDRLDETLRQRGDATAYSLMTDFQRIAEHHLAGAGGVLVDEQSGLLLATFSDMALAVQAACGLNYALSEAIPDQDWSLSGSLHRGTALVTSDRAGIRYFGATVNEARRTARLAPAGQLLLSDDIAADPAGLTLAGTETESHDSPRRIDLNTRRTHKSPQSLTKKALS